MTLVPNETPLSAADLRSLRQLAHHLKPVVRLGAGGLSEGVLGELERALTDHELIKVKLIGDRDERLVLTETICSSLAATAVQRVGATLTLLRRNPNAKPQLSVLRRFSGKG